MNHEYTEARFHLDQVLGKTVSQQEFQAHIATAQVWATLALATEQHAANLLALAAFTPTANPHVLHAAVIKAADMIKEEL